MATSTASRRCAFARGCLAALALPLVLALAGGAGARAAGDGAVNGARLRAAAAQDDVATIHRLLAEGTTVDARDRDGRTALLVATRANRIAAARALIEAGADVNAVDAIHDTPFLYAGASGHREILEMTLAHGADLRSTNRFGGTALIPAAERAHVDTVRILVDAGVAVDHVNNLGWTALLEAIILGDGGARHQAVVALLIRAGADPSLADREGVTPLAHARRRGFDAIAATLIAAGAR